MVKAEYGKMMQIWIKKSIISCKACTNAIVMNRFTSAQDVLDYIFWKMRPAAEKSDNQGTTGKY